MNNNVTEAIDEYCKEWYGHTNWEWLSTVSTEKLESTEHFIEGSVVFYQKDRELANLEEDVYYLTFLEGVISNLETLKGEDSSPNEKLLNKIEECAHWLFSERTNAESSIVELEKIRKGEKK